MKDKTKTTKPFPGGVTEEHMRFLDAVRESGKINMFGAARPLAEMCGLDRMTARKALLFWMDTFSERAATEAQRLRGVRPCAASKW